GGADRLDVVRGRDDRGARLAEELRRRAVGRHRREDRPLGGEVLEDLPGEDAPPAAAGLRDEQEERLRVALELERAPPRHVRVQLEPVAEPELLRPVAVGRAEVADEARDDVEAAPGERLQERPRAALAEEAPGVRDPEALGAVVLEPGEVVEVAAVRDRYDPAFWLERAHLLGDRIRDGDDRVRGARHRPSDRALAALLHAHEAALRPPVRVRAERVAEVGDPARARLLRRGADEVDGAR